MEPLSMSRLVVPLRSPEMPPDAKLSALTVTHLVTEWPLQTHVFVSLLHKLPIFVATSRGLWKIDGYQPIAYLGPLDPAAPHP
jgi:hypothetical protein